ncbi:hypothetical protein CDL15_Pgr016565 [Punica granatum]|uniref:Uncharacterized protein n=1 Tax=Punica granatum TaxID=22663 RepID=A0A218W6A1_PUNGR|nr:hypothetical protein CDL15_Pgr016565 [Punica granatum]
MLCPWGGGVFDLPEAGFAARAIACWGCPGHAMRDSSSRVERLRIPRGLKSESAVVLVFVVPVISTSLGGVRSSELLTASLHLGTSLGELPPSCGWSASSSSLSNLSVIEPSVGEVDHAVPEYTPSAFHGGLVRSLCADGLCRGTGRKPSEASLTKTTGKSA